MASTLPEIGLIADTHGMLHPAAPAALAGVDLILHAGDVGGAAILATLEKLALVYAVRGNADTGADAGDLPRWRHIDIAGHRILLRHGHAGDGQLGDTAGVGIIVTGHTHRAKVEWIAGVLHANPGSAGPSRSGRGASVARLTLDAAGNHTVRLIELT